MFSALLNQTLAIPEITATHSKNPEAFSSVRKARKNCSINSEFYTNIFAAAELQCRTPIIPTRRFIFRVHKYLIQELKKSA